MGVSGQRRPLIGSVEVAGAGLWPKSGNSWRKRPEVPLERGSLPLRRVARFRRGTLRSVRMARLLRLSLGPPCGLSLTHIVAVRAALSLSSDAGIRCASRAVVRVSAGPARSA